MRSKLSILIVGAFIASLPHAAPAEAAYNRIVSLGPTLTDEVCALGAGNRIIGCTTYCRIPEDAGEKEIVGAVVEVNVEKIVSLKPDLVLATSLTDPKSLKKLQDLGINIETFIMVEDFSALCGQFLKLGKILGEDEAAARIIGRTKKKVEEVSSRVKGLPPLKVFVQIGAKPLFAANKRSFINSIIEYAGGVNIVEEAQSGIYSREKVLQNDPDAIIIATMGLAGEQEREAWEGYETLSAAKNNKIFIVDQYRFCGATPENFIAALEETVKILHGSYE